jgi:CheY-like chemotaxis protein
VGELGLKPKGDRHAWAESNSLMIKQIDVNLTLLLADDDPLVHQLYSKCLEGAGYQVLHAYTGGQAIKMASTHNPPVMVLDINFPDVSGMTVLRELLKRSPMGKVPVVVITSITDIGCANGRLRH